jgi:3-oxoacyl-[acyl-carrier protein] reductase
VTKHQNKVALITGADRGIGRALASRLGAAGCKLILHSNNGDGLSKAVSDEGWPAEQVLTGVHDVADAGLVHAAVAAGIDRFGKIDYLLNVAGVAYHGGVLTTSVDDWDRTLRTNVTGYFVMARSVLPYMKEAGGGLVVNMSSIWGKRGAPPGAMMAYSVSKFAIEGFTKCLIDEARPWGVKVSSIVLDKVNTDFREHMTPHIDYTVEQRNRMLTAEDVVDAAMMILDSSPTSRPSSIELDAWLWG